MAGRLRILRAEARNFVGNHASLADLARESTFEAEGEFFCDHMTYPYVAHLAVVAVDRDTGGLDVRQYLVAYDIGRAINPMLVKRQITGGVAQGIGGALYEKFLYDEFGQPLAGTFADYMMPTAREVPPVEVLITEDAPSPLNPPGVKGAGRRESTPWARQSPPPSTMLSASR